MPTAVLAILLVLLGGLLTACSDDTGGEADEPSPAATTSETPAEPPTLAAAYTSTSVEGHDLVAGTEIELAFEDDVMSVSAGCNTLFGTYELTESTLAWAGEPASTMIGCDPELAEQDQWLAEIFSTGLTAQTDDEETLTLTGDGVTIELASAAATSLDGVLGRTWTGIATISDGTTSRLPVRTRRPTLSVRGDGLARLFTGCTSGRTTVRVDGSSLAFANTRVMRGSCTGPAGETHRAVLALLDGPSDHAELRDHLLIVTKDGRGLVFEIS
ncbi:META domain-containing protein [Nocardioides sp.]|uniref:META domain-containing protein n=1 Tax=Nocardioides sp. TaxID=35761 RepID=UPI002ED2C238